MVGPGGLRAPAVAGRHHGDLPLSEDTLDGTITCNTIYFVPDLHAGLTELARVTRPGGALVIGMADPDYVTTQPFTEHGFHVRSVEDVAAVLQACGFGEPRLHPLDTERTTFHLIRAERLP